MSQKISISLSDWVLEEIEKQKGKKYRSEFIEELIVKSLKREHPSENVKKHT